MKSIYEYSDYRKYLSDYYADKKQTLKGFSHRYFLGKAGLKGPNFLKDVMESRKNLSPASTNKFARALDLSKRELKYFSNLVLFNQAKKPKEKQRYFDALSGFARKSEVQKIQKAQYGYFSKWYNVVIREYIHCHKFYDDYKALSKTIRPRITIQQAQKAVGLLLNLGMIRLGQDGCYELTSPIISTGPEINDIGAHNLHKTMLDVGKKAIDAFRMDERYFRTIIGSFSKQSFDSIKLELDNTRKRILDIIASDTGEKKVYSMGMQLFPLQANKRRIGK
jgi:uncharacterized protein (TIGR02147 family)